MKAIHQELANGRWNQLSLIEQLGNVGSEVERTFVWKERHDSKRAQDAFERALELLDLTLQCPNNKSRLKEIARTREFFVQVYFTEDLLNTSKDVLRKYFLEFAVAARKSR